MRNVSYGKEYDLHENKSTCTDETSFHKNGFAQ